MKERSMLPKSGFRQLRSKLYDLLAEHDIGRDAFINILRNAGLMQGKSKRKGAKTTDSKHGFHTYENLTTGLQVTDIGQLIYHDITYIHTLEGFLYLAISTEAFARKIVGYDVSDSLELTGCLNALAMTAKTCPKWLLNGCIHHSDRGVQYCSKAYTKHVDALHLRQSMAAVGNCYENAAAECVNSILKREMSLDAIFATKTAAMTAVHDAIRCYNTIRPHGKLPVEGCNGKFYTPHEFFKLCLRETQPKHNSRADGEPS